VIEQRFQAGDRALEKGFEESELRNAQRFEAGDKALEKGFTESELRNEQRFQPRRSPKTGQ
jgi:hypothetical protein